MSDLIFKAIADDTRRRIIAALADGPLPVHEVAARFSVSRPAVSKHLRVLNQAGLVRVARSGKENLYALNAAPLQEVLDWLARFWGDRLALLKALSERKN